MIRALLSSAVLLLAVPAAAGDVVGRIEQVDGDAVPGGSVALRLVLEWPGRADDFVPSTPKLPVARGGTLSLGGASSSFDGDTTTWQTAARVTLPERGERWQIGPGSVLVRQREGEAQTVALPELVLGGPSISPLVGQGLGSALVILFAVGWLGLRDRQLRAEEQDAPGFGSALSEARAALDSEPWAPEATLEALLALRLDLDRIGVDNAAPSAETMREALEGLRYGGEEIARSVCSDWLAALESAAQGGRR